MALTFWFVFVMTRTVLVVVLRTAHAGTGQPVLSVSMPVLLDSLR
jgi:hypothetical protein